MVNTQDNSAFLDSVLTLRGHQITLRRAIAEGIIKDYFYPGNGEKRMAETGSPSVGDEAHKPKTD